MATPAREVRQEASMLRSAVFPTLVLCALVPVLLGPTECVQPLEATKAIASASASPNLILVSGEPVPVTVTAIILFNSGLDPASVRILDVTPGGSPAVVGSLAAAGVTPAGQLFSGEVLVDAALPGAIVLQVSAAYAGDPRRARSDPIEINVVPQAIVVPTGASFAFRIVVDLFGDVSEAEARALAAELGAGVVGFEPIANAYLFALSLDSAEPDAEAAFQDALDWLRAQSDLVESATPDYAPVEE
jgi:hypothetical protein